MEKSLSLLPEKAGTFLGRIEKNLSMAGNKHRMMLHRNAKRNNHHHKRDDRSAADADDDAAASDGSHQHLSSLLDEVDCFLETANADDVPAPAINGLATLLEKELARLEAGHQSQIPLLDAIDRVSMLAGALAVCPAHATLAARISRVLQRAMALLEEEFRSLLEDQRYAQDARSYPRVTVERLQRITAVMLPAGYERQCQSVYSSVRRDALVAAAGLGGAAAEDVQALGWGNLEGRICKWIATFQNLVNSTFPRELQLCEEVFSPQAAAAAAAFGGLAAGVVAELFWFVQAVTSTKPSIEKLYKFLDMYEATRDLAAEIDGLFEDCGDTTGRSPSPRAGIRNEMSAAMGRMAETITGIFRDLEASIRNDIGKHPIAGGAVHPLTPYVMNYLKYACEYGATLEQIFGGAGAGAGEASPASPFAAELMAIMDLLDENLNSKSRMYKDQSLSFIFLMNNGRYIAQKLKGWPEIKELLGDARCRKRSSDLRQYHKNYQRETWGKVLACLREHEGPGKVTGKAAVKEIKKQLKSFNSTLEEIHKTQRNWVVDDEQLRSELRMSLCAVVVPAYRSFLGKYRPLLGGGKTDHKYVKFGPDDVEKCIEELFEGTSASMPKKKN